MNVSTRSTEFFRAGGTLHLGAKSYVCRPADDELFQQVTAGRFCYVLTSRQMGKSSLMIRTAERVRQAGGRVATVDLSALGSQITPAQWYLGVVTRMARNLGLDIDVQQWWDERSALGPVQRFVDFLEHVVLAQIATQVVIFVDEIDSTLPLEFTDDFFAAIRVFYNLRATQSEYDRLTFVLLGVAAPGDLIKDRTRTPFNIGLALDLRELSQQDAQAYIERFDTLFPGRGTALLNRIFHWTSGHPYLTQKVCLEIVESPLHEVTDRDVDTIVKRLFLAEDAEKDSNIQFVHNYILSRPERRRLLQLYRRVYKGEKVAEDERSPVQNRLKLVGLVRADKTGFTVRNEIYRQVFNATWIQQNTPRNWIWLITASAILVSVLAIVVTLYVVQNQAEQRRTAEIQNLAGLCQIGKDEAQKRFFKRLSDTQQIDTFNAHSADSKELIATVQCLYPAIGSMGLTVERQQAVSQAMYCSLQGIADPDAESLRQKLDRGEACQR